MSNLLKILLLTAPVLAIILFYVVLRQHQMDTEFDRSEAQFDREWNEFNADFSHDQAAREKYAERANKASERMKKEEAKEKQLQERTNRFEGEFEKAIDEFGSSPEAQALIKQAQPVSYWPLAVAGAGLPVGIVLAIWAYRKLTPLKETAEEEEKV